MKIKNKFNAVFLMVLLIMILLTIYYSYNQKNRIGVLETELGFLEKKLSIIESRGYKSTSPEFYSSSAPNFAEYQKAIAEHLDKNINKLITEKPYGERWVISNLEFLSPDIIAVNYEDGHDVGSIYLKVESAYGSAVTIKPFW